MRIVSKAKAVERSAETIERRALDKRRADAETGAHKLTFAAGSCKQKNKADLG